MPETVTVEAPAKINFALHVVGRRADGYHLLDTLVGFAGCGDTVTAEAGEGISLAVEGPFGTQVGAGEDNLVLKAARLLAEAARARGAEPAGARLTLVKRLPVASGIGGGSADAAAALKALDRLWGLDLPADDLAAIGLRLGADVPMCLAGATARVGGIGEAIAPAPALPAMGLLLVNPLRPVATPAVFRALASRDNPPLPDLPEAWHDLDHLVGWLDATRNDLEAPAVAIEPAIAEVLAALRAHPSCRFARMSGSGATCFGIYADAPAARAAAARLVSARADWWVAEG